jgi:TolB protein
MSSKLNNMKLINMKKIVTLLTLLMALLALPAQAVLTIEITKGVDVGIPIAIVPFSWKGAAVAGESMSNVIEADLTRSGRFDSIPSSDFLQKPHTAKQVRFKDWRLIKADNLVVGTIEQAGAGVYRVKFQLLDVYTGKILTGYQYSVQSNKLRTVAHQISDIIYEKLTGEKGAFNTRVAYVTVEKSKKGRRYLLQVADSDGFNPQTILNSHQPLMSPAWSPDARKLAYVSFENKRSMIYVQNLSDGKRENIASFKGINSAPAFSPDGTRLAFVSSKEGNTEIYVLDLRTRALKRLTNHHGIDTEPSWMPNGKGLVFTSSRSGQPQVYRMNTDGSGVKRLTYSGKYNARPSISADGKLMVMISRSNGLYHVATLNLRTKEMNQLTSTLLDESPSFAPNGRMVLYASEQNNKGVLAAVSSDGRVRQTLRFLQGDVREPAWSPYLRR